MTDVSNFKTRYKKAVRTFFAVVVPTLAVCSLLLEGGLRLTGHAPSNMTDGFFEAHGDSYRLKRNIDKLVRTPGYVFNVYTNTLGFRDFKSGERQVGRKPYYLFLGDSLTFGNGVDFERTFVGLIGKTLEAQGIEVVNLAIGGQGLIDQVEFCDEIMRQVSRKPEKVVICFSPLFIEGFDRPVSGIVVKNGYLFEKNNWLIPYIRILFGNTSSAYCFFRDNIRKIQARLTHMDQAVVHQLIDFYSTQNRFAGSSPAAEDLESRLRGLDHKILNLGAQPVYAYVPESTDFDLPRLIKESGARPEGYDVRTYYRLLSLHCSGNKGCLIDLFPALQEFYDKGERLNFAGDAHYNAKANVVIADTILKALENKSPRENGSVE